ncbi:Uncharacterized protein DBV15_08650, partial [Temnothorax longispinosus]
MFSENSEQMAPWRPVLSWPVMAASPTLENNDNTKNKGHNDSDLTERLISEVFIREPLWNSKLPYKQRGPANMKLLWAQVDTCLGTDPGISQGKWKHLRDRFVKEYGIQNTYTASGSATKAKKTSTWYLYETLSFLIPTINYRNDLTERLISEVFIREPLWNSKLPYKQRG